MNAATTLAASVQAKKGRLYAVIQVRENGRTKPVWRATAGERQQIKGEQSLPRGGASL